MTRASSRASRWRFADPVLPGETIITEMWRESDTKILFRVKSKDRDKVVISNAAVELYTEIPKPKAKPAASASTGAVATGPNSADIFAGIAAFFAKTPGTGDKVKTVFQFQLSNPSSVWTLDLSSGSGSVASGETAAPGCTLAITEADFLDMCTGKADAMKLFTGGKLKITGNVMASQKLDFLKKVDPQTSQQRCRSALVEPLQVHPQPPPFRVSRRAPTSSRASANSSRRHREPATR